MKLSQFDILVSDYVENRSCYRRYDNMDGPKDSDIYSDLYYRMTRAKQKLTNYVIEETNIQLVAGVELSNVIID